MYKLQNEGEITLYAGSRNARFKCVSRPDLDFGLGIYLRLLDLRTFFKIKNHDFNKKAKISTAVYKAITQKTLSAPSWEEFKKAYSDFFIFLDDFQPCPGQQSLESVMKEPAPVQETPEVKKSEPGSVYGDTPNGLKTGPVNLDFVDVFNRSCRPLEIDGKLYQPHLELIDVNSDQN